MGPFHHQFEEELKDYFKVKYVSLVTNGTIGLLLALRVLDIKGEVITTPFSFVATTHVLQWSNIKPVFVDIHPEDLNIDPLKIKDAITSNTQAILPVHVYGNHCKVLQIKKVAQEYKLKIIYDASHAFGVKIDDNSILNYGDLSIVSFHATKAFNTFEGGAIISKTKTIKEKIDKFKNHGIVNETTIDGFGINGKMNEFQAAIGILQMKYFDDFVFKRFKIAETYKKELEEVPGIRFINVNPEVKNNYAFLPILVDESKFGKSRDFLYNHLKKNGIYTRRYFYPLISEIPMYMDLPSASKKNLPIATKISKQILCLPIYPEIENDTILRIVELIKCIK
jgi:dTDP-4-amino-4,6-dideoxygalactose transaminase